MKVIRISLMLLALCILATGCADANETPSQQENGRIPILENLEPQEIRRIDIQTGNFQ